ncbi:MAG: glycosyltransferase family 8 protein [Lachnospiraceae bacterium]|nr:glycosyltransferase family 8 protein [Lachnospiraceae bacterium]
MNKIMNVVYHSSDLFSPVLGVSLASVFENNTSMEEINVYIFDTAISDINKNKLYELAAKYSRSLHFIQMPDINKTQRLGLKDVGKAGWFFNSYMKLFLDELLPENVERVLYLDSDVLVTSDLTELWNMDMNGGCAAGVIDCLGEAYYKVLGLNDGAMYCNSGIILVDLINWKKQRIGQRVREYCAENGGYVFFMEQTAFNAALQEEIIILHPKYNVYSMMQILSYDELVKLRKLERYYTKEDIQEAVKKPVMIHLTNSFLLTNRAWHENSNHPEKELYEKYKEKTPWKEEPGFKDTRNVKDKIIQVIVDVLPRPIVLSVASVLYNYIRVRKIEKLIKEAKKSAN